MVIIDECHHGASHVFENVLRQINSKYIYGVSANDKRIEKLDNRNQVKIKKISMIFHGFYCTLKIPEEKALFFRVV